MSDKFSTTPIGVIDSLSPSPAGFRTHRPSALRRNSSAWKRCQLDRGEDGEVFDTGRPIVDYKLVEIEERRSKKQEFFNTLRDNLAIDEKLYPNAIYRSYGLKSGTISEMSRRFNVTKQIVKRWNEEFQDDYKLMRNKNLEKAMLNIQSQSSTPTELIASLYRLSTADVEDLKWTHRRDQEKIKKSKAPDIAESLVMEGFLMSFNICKLSALHPSKFKQLYPEYRGSQYEEIKEYVTKLVADRHSIYEICKLAKIPQSQFRRWFPKYRLMSTQ